MRRRYAIGAAATAIAAGAIAAPVFAASSGSSSSATTHAHPPGGQGPWRAGGFIGDPSQYDATVAAKLGITTAKFEAAEQAVRASMKPPTPGATGMNPSAMRTAVEDALAAKLGVSTSTLTAAEQSADQTLILKNLSTLASHGVLTKAQAAQLTAAATSGTFATVLHDIEVANLTTHLDAAVKAGRLTQAQADKILARAKSETTDDGPGLGLGLGFGGPGGPGGPHGPGGPGGPMGRGPWGGTGPTGAPPSSGSGTGTSTTATTTTAA
jgi:hypothetical protein